MLFVEAVVDNCVSKICLEAKNVVSLSNFMIAMKQALSLSTDFILAYFQYLDEEGDTVVVQSEDEFQAMLQSILDGRLDVGTEVKPLKIWPVLRKKSKTNMPALNLSVCRPNEDLVEEQMDSVDMETDLLAGSSRSQRAHVDNPILNNPGICNTQLHPISILGSGHSGSVFKALDTVNDRFVAVKSIALDVADAMKEQILSEMNILYQCSSPFIIGFYGVDFIDNRISIYTEYMDAGSFDKAVKRAGKIPESVVNAVAVAVVNGLCYLWKMKIMHRDIKPSNILVNSAGDIKLCDFGVSVQLANSIAKSYVGTSVYMAPERLLGHQYTIRSDVWSLGLTLLELALGRFPYNDINRTQDQRPMMILERIINNEPPSLPDDFGQELREFVTVCLQKEPGRRQTFDELSQHSLIILNQPFNSALIADWVNKTLLPV